MPPSPSPNSAGNQTLSPPQKQPQPPAVWSHEETVNLIQAYQEKWYSLKRGQLKASSWEEVAFTVASRLGVPPHLSKSDKQCRHKIEKLRKRYRAENQKIPHSLSWIYFPLMDRLERGASAAATADLQFQLRQSNERRNQPDFDQEGVVEVVEVLDDDEEEEDDDVIRVDHHRSKPNYYLGQYVGDPRSERVKRQRMGSGGYFDSETGRGGVEAVEEEDDGGVSRVLAGEMKEFVERFVKMEKKKMEIIRENERFKIEMENKRLQMILLSHQKTADLISKTFGLNNTPES